MCLFLLGWVDGSQIEQDRKSDFEMPRESALPDEITVRDDQCTDLLNLTVPLYLSENGG